MACLWRGRPSRKPMACFMFEIEYRTISRLGLCYPSQIAMVGSHKASSCDEAEARFLSKTSNVEVVDVRFVGVC